MRDIGIVTLMSVAATAAAPVLPAARSAPLVTTKSTEQFAGCFASVQERRSAAWWFVPNGKGGTFSNLGAAGTPDRSRDIRLQGPAVHEALSAVWRHFVQG